MTRKFLPILPLTLVACAHQRGVEKLSYGDAAFSVEISKYAASKQPSAKTLLILPPTGGSTYLDRSFARVFEREGYDVYILERWTELDDPSDDLDLHHRAYDRGQRAITLTLEHVKSAKIGLLGTSVGATHAALASNVQPRIDALFAIAGGVPLSEVIVESDHRTMVDLKKRRYAKLGFKDDGEYLATLKPHVAPVEPEQRGTGYRRKILGQTIATKDTTVPTREQRQLEDWWKPTTRYDVSGGHVYAIVKNWLFHQYDILDFFERALEAKP